MEGSTNIPIMFIKWWYGEAYSRLFAYLKHLFVYTYDLFSVKLCLKTFFYPWKRDQLSTEGLSLQQQFQIWTLNQTSRLIGAVIKLFTLLTFILVALVQFALSVAIFIIWLIYPLFLAGLIVFGLKYF